MLHRNIGIFKNGTDPSWRQRPIQHLLHYSKKKKKSVRRKVVEVQIVGEQKDRYYKGKLLSLGEKIK